MRIAVLGNDASWNELISCNKNIAWVRINEMKELATAMDVDGFFLLDENINPAEITLPEKPVFINSVIRTLKEINAPKNIIRINGWSGFLSRSLWEISGILDDSASDILKESGKEYVNLADEPGFISARIIAMIINEAYYAEGEKVSDRKAIDVAMKLGTNYPHGPFEWADIIGIQHIYALLKKLSFKDSRYTVAPALDKLINP